jgi:2-polyprenyl-6-methoxyphenol hydroxylase-like FAD-dependent oxidoreductase
MYDAIIVGARCAGASTAMLLARRGHKVLLVDRATFPSDIPHGHFLHRGGPARLQRWGLLERVAATGAPAITAMTTDYGDFTLSDRDIMVDGAPLGYGPRRQAIDRILVEAAVEAGAELRTGFAVQDYMGDGTRITGIRGRNTGGALVTDRGRVTIGADGRNSRLARTVASQAYEATPPLTCWYFSYWSGAPGDAIELYLRDGNRVIIAFPSDEGLLAVFVAWPASLLSVVRSEIARHFMEAVHRTWLPGFARAGRRSASSGRRTFPTSSARRTVRVGRWSPTRGATRIRSWHWACATRSAMRSCLPTRWMTGCPERAR